MVDSLQKINQMPNLQYGFYNQSKLLRNLGDNLSSITS